MTETGRLGIPRIESYRRRMLGLPDDGDTATDLDATLLSGLGLNILEATRFLLEMRPSLQDFEDWIEECNGGTMPAVSLERLRRALEGEQVGPEAGNLDSEPGLSADDLRFWDEHGYVILRGAITAEATNAGEMAVYHHLNAHPDNPESWYHGRGHSIWVPLLRHPDLDANRRSRRITKAFAQLWGREDLWPTIDQAGLNPPERPGWLFPGPLLHWDTTLARPHHFGVQGILYLADVAEDQGAFCCIPGFHRILGEWLDGLPPFADPTAEIRKHLEVIQIAGNAGDMVLWHQSLPHGASPNRATRPRVVQYLQMWPTRWAWNDLWLQAE